MKKKKTFWVVATVVFVLCVAVGLIFIFGKKNQEESFEMQKPVGEKDEFFIENIEELGIPSKMDPFRDIK